MTFWTLLFGAGCLASYKLGARNQKHPEQLQEWLRRCWDWLHA